MLFNSPGTYLIGVVFLLLMGWFFSAPLFVLNQSSLQTFLEPIPILFTFLIPALTMKLFAEELKAGTMESLATLPLKDYEIVLGKYLAALGFLGVFLLFTLAYPLFLFVLGKPDAGQMIGAYGAVFGLGAFYAAIGLWASSVTRNQVVAFILGFFVCFLFFLLGFAATLLPGAAGEIVRLLSVDAHFASLARGVFDTRDLSYWLSGTAFFLSASLAAVHSRRWT